MVAVKLVIRKNSAPCVSIAAPTLTCGTRKKLHSVNFLHGPPHASASRRKINSLLGPARVREIRSAENLNTRGPAYRDEYISVIIRNQRIVRGSESRPELRFTVTMNGLEVAESPYDTAPQRKETEPEMRPSGRPPGSCGGKNS